jgi:hypothetical protein
MGPRVGMYVSKGGKSLASAGNRTPGLPAIEETLHFYCKYELIYSVREMIVVYSNNSNDNNNNT